MSNETKVAQVMAVALQNLKNEGGKVNHYTCQRIEDIVAVNLPKLHPVKASLTCQDILALA